jgi:biopolymer transport protein ExbD
MNKILLVIGVLLCLLYFFWQSESTSTQNVHINNNLETAAGDTSPQTVYNTTQESPKSKEEVYVEAGLKVGGIVLDKLKEKRKRDSIELANRGKVLAYAIGMPKTDKDELWNTYSKTKDIGNIYAFKNDNSYYLIQVTNYTEEEMQDSLRNITAAFAQKGVADRIEVVNILGFCKRKESIAHGKNIKIRRKGEIPCYVCD